MSHPLMKLAPPISRTSQDLSVSREVIKQIWLTYKTWYGLSGWFLSCLFIKVHKKNIQIKVILNNNFKVLAFLTSICSANALNCVKTVLSGFFFIFTKFQYAFVCSIILYKLFSYDFLRKFSFLSVKVYAIEFWNWKSLSWTTAKK